MTGPSYDHQPVNEPRQFLKTRREPINLGGQAQHDLMKIMICVATVSAPTNTLSAPYENSSTLTLATSAVEASTYRASSLHCLLACSTMRSQTLSPGGFQQSLRVKKTLRTCFRLLTFPAGIARLPRRPECCGKKSLLSMMISPGGPRLLKPRATPPSLPGPSAAQTVGNSSAPPSFLAPPLPLSSCALAAMVSTSFQSFPCTT